MKTPPHQTISSRTGGLLCLWFFGSAVLLVSGCATTGNKSPEHKEMTASQMAEMYYASKIAQKLKENFHVPSQYQSVLLETSIFFRLNERGHMHDLHIDKTSGDKGYDDFVLDTARKSEPFPVPPSSWKDQSMVLNLKTY